MEDRRTIYALYLRATATAGRAEDATETLVSEINAFDLSGFIDDIQARGGREADTYIQIHYINQINPMEFAALYRMLDLLPPLEPLLPLEPELPPLDPEPDPDPPDPPELPVEVLAVPADAAVAPLFP